MVNKKKLISGVLQGLFLVLILIPLFFTLIFQIPAIQTQVAREVVSSLEGSMDGHLSIDRVSIVFFNRVVAYGMTVTGNGGTGVWGDGDTASFHNPGDTLAHVGKLSVSFSPFDLMAGNLRVHRVIVSDGCFKLLNETPCRETNLTRIFRVQPKDPQMNNNAIPDLTADNIRIDNFSLRISNPFSDGNVRDEEGLMNYQDIDIRGITGRITDLKTRDGVLTANIHSLSAVERCGADLKMLSGKYYMGPEEAGMDDVFLQEGEGTFLRASHISFHYGDKDNLQEWVDKVVMDVTFTGTEFEFYTIRHFTPGMENNHLKFILDGRVTGPLVDMHAENLHISFPEGGASADLNLEINGLPDMPNTTITGTVGGVSASMRDIASIASEWTGHPESKPLKGMAPGQVFRYSADISGPFRNMLIKGRLNAAGGTVIHNTYLHLFASREISVDGAVSISDFDISRITGSGILGPADIRMGGCFSTGSGTSLSLDSLIVDGLECNGYRFSDIMAQGKMKNGVADIRVVSHDDALDLLAHLQADFNSGEGWKNLGAFIQIPYADLSRMNIIRGKTISRIENVWAQTRMNVKSIRDIEGEVRLTGLTYSNERGSFVMDTLLLNSDFVDGRYVLELNSPVAGASYCGEDPVAEALVRMKELLLRDQFDEVFPGGEARHGILDGPGRDSLSLDIHIPQELTEMLSPGLFISPNTGVNVSLREDDSFDASLSSPRLAINENYLKDVKITADNPDSLLRLAMNCPELHFAGFRMIGNSLDLKSVRGVIGMEFISHDETASVGNEMEFSSEFFFTRDASGGLRTDISISESDCFLNGMRWHIPASDVTFGKNYYSFDRFRLHNDGQEISLQGIVSENPEDEMKLHLDSFDIGMVDLFIKNKLNLGGDFTGDMSIKDLYGRANILMDLKGDSVSFHKNDLGHLSIKSKWDPKEERILLILNNKFRDLNPINISGYYHPSSRYLFMNLSLRDLALTYVNPFLKNVVNVTGGTVSGDISLQGPLDKLILTSEDTRFVDLAFSPVFSKVPYVMNGRMDFTENGIMFNDILITDRNDHSAHLNGSIHHRFFKDMDMDLSLSFSGLECLDTKERDSPSFYGYVTGDGLVSVRGPLSALDISAAFENGPGTNVHIPIMNASSASSGELLTFKDYQVVEVDPYERFLSRKKKVEKTTASSSLKLYAYARLNEDALIGVDIDKNMGNVINCRGKGNVEVTVIPSSSMLDVRGDYVLSGGDAHYNMAGLLSKNFTLDNGGKIVFNGPVSGTTLNVGATYRTKASVATLISDTTSVGVRQTILCGVKVRGSLMDPRISFSIDIPDLEPMTKGRVEAALNSEAKVQQQFMALMITGGFIPDRQSGIENNNSVLFSNVGEMLANTVNNVFHTLDIPLDMGLKYQRSSSKDLIDVNLSYQAFNNRLVLNGSVGNSQASKNWGGNFEAELKLDRQGKFRFSLFTKAPDPYKNILDNSQRAGFGFTFQSEFDRFIEVFMGRRKREEYDRKLMEKAEEELLRESGQLKNEE